MANHVQVRLRRGAALLVATALPLAWLLGSAAAVTRSPDNRTAVVGDAAEAWFAATPVDLCTTPVGCPPQQAPTSPYPADTLHVGVAGGRETSRTYLLPDLTSLPPGANVVDATMTLPVASGTTDGTVSADAARIIACLVTQPFPDGAQGATGPAPTTDCRTSVKPTYDAAHGQFVLELNAFVQAWANFTPDYGVVLLPDTATAGPTDVWHVTFNGRKRAGTPRVSTDVTYRVAQSPATAPLTQPAVPPAPGAPVAARLVPVTPAGAPPAAAPPVVAPRQPAALPAQAAAFTTRFQYPLAFLVPLALLAGAVFFGRLFTRDLTPRRTGT